MVYLTYFACVPVSTRWRDLPEFTLSAWVGPLSLCTMVLGIIALARRSSRPIRGVVVLVLVMSVWLFMFGCYLGFSF